MIFPIYFLEALASDYTLLHKPSKMKNEDEEEGEEDGCLLYQGKGRLGCSSFCLTSPLTEGLAVQNRDWCLYTWVTYLLPSAVGMAHVLRSRLVMDYTTSYFPLIVLEYPLDSKRSYGSFGPLLDTLCPGA